MIFFERVYEQLLRSSNQFLSDSLSGLQVGDFLDVLKSNSSVYQTGRLTAVPACDSVIFLDVSKSNSSVHRTDSRLAAVPACKSVIFFFERLREQQLSLSNRSSDSRSSLRLGEFFDVLKSNGSVLRTGSRLPKKIFKPLWLASRRFFLERFEEQKLSSWPY